MVTLKYNLVVLSKRSGKMERGQDLENNAEISELVEMNGVIIKESKCHKQIAPLHQNILPQIR